MEGDDVFRPFKSLRTSKACGGGFLEPAKARMPLGCCAWGALPGSFPAPFPAPGWVTTKGDAWGLSGREVPREAAVCEELEAEAAAASVLCGACGCFGDDPVTQMGARAVEAVRLGVRLAGCEVDFGDGCVSNGADVLPLGDDAGAAPVVSDVCFVDRLLGEGAARGWGKNLNFSQTTIGYGVWTDVSYHIVHSTSGKMSIKKYEMRVGTPDIRCNW